MYIISILGIFGVAMFNEIHSLNPHMGILVNLFIDCSIFGHTGYYKAAGSYFGFYSHI